MTRQTARYYWMAPAFRNIELLTCDVNLESCCRNRSCSPPALLKTSPTESPTPAIRKLSPLPKLQLRMNSSRHSLMVTKPRSASAVHGSPAESAIESRWQGHFCVTAQS